MSSPSGFIKLYDVNGNEVKASTKELVQIAKTIPHNLKSPVDLMRRLTGNRSAHYWLVADYRGLPAMLLEIHLFNHYPRPSGKWSCSIGLDGIASSSKFDSSSLEHAIRSFMEPTTWCVDDADRVGMPESVARVARQHVRYRRP